MLSAKLGYQARAVAFYMALTNLNGISSMKLHRELAMTQIGALHMLWGIRQVFWNSEAILAGTVEIDEIFIGRKERYKLESKGFNADRATVGKTVVIGAKERGGKVAATSIPATVAKTLGEFVAETVEPGSTVWRDATITSGNWREYNCDAVNHSAGSTSVARFAQTASRDSGCCSSAATTASIAE